MPGVLDQAAGEVRDVTMLDLEANGDDLQEETNDPALLEDHHGVLLDLVVFTEEQGLLLHRIYSVATPLCMNKGPAPGRSDSLFILDLKFAKVSLVLTSALTR